MAFTAIQGIRDVEAAKAVTLQGTSYQPGDRVDVSGLDDFKVTQLLRQRILRPAAPKPKAKSKSAG